MSSINFPKSNKTISRNCRNLLRTKCNINNLKHIFDKFILKDLWKMFQDILEDIHNPWLNITEHYMKCINLVYIYKFCKVACMDRKEMSWCSQNILLDILNSKFRSNKKQHLHILNKSLEDKLNNIMGNSHIPKLMVQAYISMDKHGHKYG